jgi:hypothetical protein
MRQYSAYAGPSTWGPWVKVAEHTAPITFDVTATPVGNTVLRCRVRYFRTDTQQATEEWRDNVRIHTGNCVAVVEVSFMGVPTGSAVDGTVDP